MIKIEISEKYKKRLLLKYSKGIRKFLRSKNISTDNLKNEAVIELFAKIKFNEIIDSRIKSSCHEWLFDKFISGELSIINIKFNLKNKSTHRTVKNKSNINNETINSTNTEDYDKFLKSVYWLRIRKSTLRRDKNRCIKCGSKLNLQIHHLTYVHHYDEHNHLEDLITLCEICHKKEHFKNC